MALPVFDMSTPAGRQGFASVLARLRATTSMTGEAADTVARIIDDVRRDGDDAVVRYMRQWTDPTFTAERIRVTRDEMDAALAALDGAFRKVLELSIAHVREYQAHILPRAVEPITIDGAEMGLRFTPVDSAGLAVPGGRAAYPSSVIMLTVPAQAAGVARANIRVVTPPPTRQGDEPTPDVSPLVLATCALLEIEHVYRIGGAQAIAALALGTDRVEPVDMIVGPGNIFTQLAKAQLAGRVGIDGFYGPSEIVTIADESADASRLAADLIAQAEHDPGKCFLVSWSPKVIDSVLAALAVRLMQRARREPIEKALAAESAAVLVADRAQAIEVANTLAAEHVLVATADAEALLGELRHGGEFFIGDATPVAAGDYIAGPSHCLPTGTTARFASGVSVYTFLRRSGTVAYRDGMPAHIIDAIAKFAEAEGLDGHADSARIRGEG